MKPARVKAASSEHRLGSADPQSSPARDALKKRAAGQPFGAGRTSADSPLRPLRIALFDEHLFSRRGIEHVLAELGFVDLVASVTSLQQLAAILASIDADLLLLATPSVREAVEGLLLAGHRRLPALILASVEVDVHRERILALGAANVLLTRDLSPDVLAHNLLDISTRVHKLPPKPPTAAHDSSSAATVLARLTPREQRVLELLAEGLRNRQIAERLRISEHSVKRAVAFVLAKLGSPNRTTAAAIAMREGWLTHPISRLTAVGATERRGSINARSGHEARHL